MNGRIKLILVVFASWLIVGGWYWSKNAMDSLSLWIVLPLMYAPLVYFAKRANYLMLFLFMLAVFCTQALSPSEFFFEKDNYQYSGWAAVKSFNFSVENYIYISSIVLFCYVWVLISALIFRRIFLGRVRYNKIKAIVEYPLEICSKLTSGAATSSPKPHRFVQNKDGSFLHGFILIVVIALCAILNAWMFDMGVGITSLTGPGAQPVLPFKLNGILYHFTRFVVPVIIYYLYSRSSRSLFLALLIMVYAAWAGISQLSRETYSLIVIPALFFALLDRRYSRLAVMTLLFLSFYPVIEYARGFIYLVTDDVVSRNNTGDNILSLALKAIGDAPDSVTILSIIFGVLNRIDSVQVVVLGYQFNTDALGGAWANFMRVFSIDISNSADAQYELYAFQTPYGFSVGAGGLSSMMLQVYGGNWLLLIPIGFWIGFWIALCELLICRYVKRFDEVSVGYFLAVMFVFFFYALGIYNWFLIMFIVVWLGLRFIPRREVALEIRTAR